MGTRSTEGGVQAGLAGRFIVLAATLAALGGPARAQGGPVGTMTFDDPSSPGGHVIALETMYFSVAPAARLDVEELKTSRTVTVTVSLPRVDPALIDWLNGPKRQVTVKLGGDGERGSVFVLDGVGLGGLNVGFAGDGDSHQTLELAPEHMTIDGLAVY